MKPKDIIIKRSEDGIPPSDYEKLFNKKVCVKKKIPKDTVIHKKD